MPESISVPVSGSPLEQVFVTPAKWQKWEALKFLYQNWLSLMSGMNSEVVGPGGDTFTYNSTIDNSYPAYNYDNSIGPTTVNIGGNTFGDTNINNDIANVINTIVNNNIGGVTTNISNQVVNNINNNLSIVIAANLANDLVDGCTFLNKGVNVYSSEQIEAMRQTHEAAIISFQNPILTVKRLTVDFGINKKCNSAKFQLQWCALADLVSDPDGISGQCISPYLAGTVVCLNQAASDLMGNDCKNPFGPLSFKLKNFPGLESGGCPQNDTGCIGQTNCVWKDEESFAINARLFYYNHVPCWKACHIPASCDTVSVPPDCVFGVLRPCNYSGMLRAFFDRIRVDLLCSFDCHC